MKPEGIFRYARRTVLMAVWGGLFAISASGEGAGARGEGLVFEEEHVVFSDIHPGEVVDYVFHFSNRDEMPIRILKVTPT